jgi:hypothetical protein
LLNKQTLDAFIRLNDFVHNIAYVSLDIKRQSLRKTIYASTLVDTATLTQYEKSLELHTALIIADPFLYKKWAAINKQIVQASNIGLYFFYEILPDTSWKLLRVGETGDLVQRLSQYRELGKRSGSSKFVDYIRQNNQPGKFLLEILQLPMQSTYRMRVDLELFYIMAYKPEFNDRVYYNENAGLEPHPASAANMTKYFVYEVSADKPRLLVCANSLNEVCTAVSTTGFRSFTALMDTGRPFRETYLIYTYLLTAGEIPVFNDVVSAGKYTKETVASRFLEQQRRVAVENGSIRSKQVFVYSYPDGKYLDTFPSHMKAQEVLGISRPTIRLRIQSVFKAPIQTTLGLVTLQSSAEVKDPRP